MDRYFILGLIIAVVLFTIIPCMEYLCEPLRDCLSVLKDEVCSLHV